MEGAQFFEGGSLEYLFGFVTVDHGEPRFTTYWAHDLLRRRKLVDLYKVVREGVRISEPGYSLKNVEVFFSGDRSGEVKTALDSMVVYDQWQQTGDQALLDQIAQESRASAPRKSS